MEQILINLYINEINRSLDNNEKEIIIDNSLKNTIINEENDFLPDEFPYVEEIQEENDFQTYVTDEKIYDPNTTIYPHQEEEYSYQQYQFDETLLNEKDKIFT